MSKRRYRLISYLNLAALEEPNDREHLVVAAAAYGRDDGNEAPTEEELIKLIDKTFADVLLEGGGR